MSTPTLTTMTTPTPESLRDLARKWLERSARHRREYHALPAETAYDGARRDKEALERAHKHCARELEEWLEHARNRAAEWRQRADDWRKKARELDDMGHARLAAANHGRADEAVCLARELEALLGEETR